MNNIILSAYKKLLRCYPKELRERYSDQMIITATDMLADRKGKSVAAVWLRLGVDLQRHVIAENVKYVGGKFMNKNNPIVHFVAWAAIAVSASLCFSLVQSIGTTWKNNQGFLRLLGLLAYIALLVIVPAIMALLALFGRTVGSHKKLAHK
jgi:hypothetical protein